MRFQQIGLAIATVAFVSGCSAGRRAPVNMVEDVDIPATHRSQYAPEYPSPYGNSGSDSDSDSESTPPRQLPESLRRHVKSVSRASGTETRVSDHSARSNSQWDDQQKSGPPVREAGLLRWQSQETASSDCSVEEGCYGQPAGTSLCHRLRLLFRQSEDCCGPDPYAFCGTVTFEETLAGRRIYSPQMVPVPAPSIDPERPARRSGPDRRNGGRVPSIPPQKGVPDEQFPPENLPEENMVPGEPEMPEPADIATPPELPVIPQPESESQPPGDNKPKPPGQKPNYVEPPQWFRKTDDPSRSGKKDPVAPKKPASGPSAEAVYPEPEVMQEEENVTSEVEEQSETAPAATGRIGPTSLPSRLKPTSTRGGRLGSRL